MIHGDGRWVVFRRANCSRTVRRALLPAALVWARHAFAMRDWAKGSASHGNAKVVGELPPDTPLSDAEGTSRARRRRSSSSCMAVASQDAPAGIRPAGSKIDYHDQQLAGVGGLGEARRGRRAAAARIYLGTDGVLGAQGGAPGVDISALFGVATSKVQSDLACIERGVQTGLIAPWAAINFGDDKLAPTRPTSSPTRRVRVREDFGKRNAAFLAAVKAAKDAGYVVDQAFTDKLAKEYGVPAAAAPAARPRSRLLRRRPPDPRDLEQHHARAGRSAPRRARAESPPRAAAPDAGPVSPSPPRRAGASPRRSSPCAGRCGRGRGVAQGHFTASATTSLPQSVSPQRASRRTARPPGDTGHRVRASAASVHDRGRRPLSLAHTPRKPSHADDSRRRGLVEDTPCTSTLTDRASPACVRALASNRTPAQALRTARRDIAHTRERPGQTPVPASFVHRGRIG
jgi:hypothetical protein